MDGDSPSSSLTWLTWLTWLMLDWVWHGAVCTGVQEVELSGKKDEDALDYMEGGGSGKGIDSNGGYSGRHGLLEKERPSI